MYDIGIHLIKIMIGVTIGVLIIFTLLGCGLRVAPIGFGYDRDEYDYHRHRRVLLPLNCHTDWCSNTRCGIWE